ncbi:MAG: hypothetical protein WCG14_06745 [Chlamydiia bacterium]
MKNTFSKGKRTKETHYYIASLIEGSEQIGSRVSAHSGVDSMHRSIDVPFREDESRANLLHGALNVGTLRRACINIVKSDPGLKKVRICQSKTSGEVGRR